MQLGWTLTFVATRKFNVSGNRTRVNVSWKKFSGGGYCLLFYQQDIKKGQCEFPRLLAQ
jgi:hypothetical protein